MTNFLLCVLLLLSSLLSIPAVQAQSKTLVVLRSANEANRFDPQRDTTHASGVIVTLLTDSLVSIDQDLKSIRPHLAESWTISPDRMTYVFRLRKDVKYCSGRSMTSKDVVGTFARWRDPATRSTSRFRIGSVDSIRALDDYTVEMKLKKPDNELLLQLGTHFASIIDPEQAAELKENFGVTAFNGVGPFCLERWLPRQEVVLRRHEAYRWGPPQFENKGPAKVERIQYKSVPEESTMAATMTSGGGMLTSTLADWAKEKVGAQPNIAHTPGREVGFSPTLWLRVSKAPLDDLRIRKALTMAIDRPQLAKAVWGNGATPAWSYSALGVRDADPTLEKFALKFDKVAAARLLEESGWKAGSDGIRQKNGQRLSLTVYGQDLPQWRNLLGAIYGMWQAVGVDLQIKLWEPRIAFSKLSGQEWDLALYNNIHISTGDSLYNAFDSVNIGKSNRIGYKDPETDRLIEVGRTTADDGERFRNYRRAQERLLSEVPAIPLYDDQRQIFYNKTMVKGVKDFGIYGIMLYKALDIELLP